MSEIRAIEVEEQELENYLESSQNKHDKAKNKQKNRKT